MADETRLQAAKPRIVTRSTARRIASDAGHRRQHGSWRADVRWTFPCETPARPDSGARLKRLNVAVVDRVANPLSKDSGFSVRAAGQSRVPRGAGMSAPRWWMRAGDTKRVSRTVRTAARRGRAAGLWSSSRPVGLVAAAWVRK